MFLKFIACFRIFLKVPKVSRKFRNVPEFSIIFRNVLECSRIFDSFSKCSRMFHDALEYSGMFRNHISNASNCFPESSRMFYKCSGTESCRCYVLEIALTFNYTIYIIYFECSSNLYIHINKK